MKLVVLNPQGDPLGHVETDEPIHVGAVVGPVVRDTMKSAPPLTEQLGTLTIGEITVGEILTLQGKRVAIFQLHPETT